MKLKRMITITKKEFVHIRRDKPSLIMALIAPIMMLLVFGYAVNMDVNNIDVVVYDGSKSHESRELVELYGNSHYFKINGYVDSPDIVEEYIDMGKVKVGLIIPPQYDKSIRRGEASEIQLLIDGSDPTIARTATSYSLLLTNKYNINMRQLNIRSSGAGTLKGTAIEAKPLVLYNPSLISSKFNIPGVVGLILQNITIMLTAFAMVREREKGTIEQLIMTPVSSLELIFGKLIPYIIIGLYDFVLVLLLSYFIFGVAVKGSILLLTLLGLLFLIGALAMGMLISTIAKTQLQAMQASILLLLPSVLLSGFMFPREAMPKLIYYISNMLPITYFLEILRGIMLKGVSLKYLANTTLYLSILIFIIVAITMKKFTKKLD